MRAEDHHPRKSDGNNHNCGHAARTRSLNPCERPFRSACGPETDVKLAGWPPSVAPDDNGETSLELASGGFGRVLTPGARHQTRIRTVDSCEDVFSDPGANPGASIYHLARAGPFTFPRSRRRRRSPLALACTPSLTSLGRVPFNFPALAARSRLAPRGVHPRQDYA
jgi:hypothetical protein